MVRAAAWTMAVRRRRLTVPSLGRVGPRPPAPPMGRSRRTPLSRRTPPLWTPAISTHELAHTFGATDRYFDAGGQLQYGNALMSTVTRPLRQLEDAVFWGEAGLGDLDRDGELDALGFSRAPESLEHQQLVVKAYPAPTPAPSRAPFPGRRPRGRDRVLAAFRP